MVRVRVYEARVKNEVPCRERVSWCVSTRRDNSLHHYEITARTRPPTYLIKIKRGKKYLMTSVFFLRALGRFFFILTLRHRGVTKIDAPYLSRRAHVLDLFTCVCAAESREATGQKRIYETLNH